MLKREIFIVGAKGIPARYGGFESFVDQLTARKQTNQIHYYVACRRDLSENKADFYEYNDATCFNVDVPNIGPARAIMYDIKALKESLKIIRQKNIENPIIYVLACRMGPFINHFKKQLKKFNGKLLVNPDGHEWLRAKWSIPVRKYWKLSEQLMVKHADLLICDSQNIEEYIKTDYSQYQPQTRYIAYGSDIKRSEVSLQDKKVQEWYKKFDIKLNKYYLIVGRFVPENNYETMIKEFMKSNTNKDLVIITNVEKNKFYNDLEKTSHFLNDKRIKFVGTVYDSKTLKFIRENAFAYLHGHEVGGTNPSLLEALGSTKVNLLLDVGFNREVGMNGAHYWSKVPGSLSKLINSTENLSEKEINQLELLAKGQISNHFDWVLIVDRYEKAFTEN
ncbi:beta 1-4 rhamnosyltransferase Cps2T [Lactiplantibacillus plantarum]|uniref:beta 1-4 rhamnosyltransferase Cps2T n=1 Tax=Lactiplantibacillus plantarum TaxID=1590 RepID=UPI0039C18C35